MTSFVFQSIGHFPLGYWIYGQRVKVFLHYPLTVPRCFSDAQFLSSSTNTCVLSFSQAGGILIAWTFPKDWLLVLLIFFYWSPIFNFTGFCSDIYFCILLDLDLICSSISHFLKWNHKWLIFRPLLSSKHAHCFAFPLSTALPTAYKFWHIVFSIAGT